MQTCGRAEGLWLPNVGGLSASDKLISQAQDGTGDVLRIYSRLSQSLFL